MRAELIFLSVALAAVSSAQNRVLRSGDVITQSTTIERRVYDFPPPGDERGAGVIKIQGDNLTIDFNGATLQGSPPTTEPNMRTGVGIEVKGRNITIKNLNVRGYKVGLIARDTPRLSILDSDFSYNWKQRLLSTLEREDLSDWMSYHQNEKDEWLRFGAGIYLSGCSDFEVKGCVIQGGQNGLMMTRSNRGRVWNNNFSFLSSLGIGMYRSSDNRIMHNKVDWCVRGYSHGVYNRGQDSAGILIYEQSHRNTFAYNSVTHGGDGFFLWAGQTTMDTAQGGCNDNLLYGNDWSHAPTNGIEATFSRNNFVNNLILECWHGIWGGYSYESKVIGNVFGLNAEAIAWEHGQDNVVERNVFHRDNMGINLWANATQDPNWGYPKNRDTRSRDWTINNNLFSDILLPSIQVRRSTNVNVTNNRFENVGLPAISTSQGAQVNVGRGNVFRTTSDLLLKIDNENRTISGANVQSGRAPLPATMQPSGNVILGLDPSTPAYLKRFDVGWQPWPVRDAMRREIQAFAPTPMAGGMDPFIKKGDLRGRRYILVDHWGPYDFKSPLLWPRGVIAEASSVAVDAQGNQTGPNRSQDLLFELLGPAGSARIVEATGARITGVSRDGQTWTTPAAGADLPVPGYLRVTMEPGKAANVNIQLDYRGGATTDYRGVVTPAGQPVRFGFKRFFMAIDWTVNFYQWTQQVDPSDPISVPVESHIRTVLTGTPLRTVKTDRLDYASGGAFLPGLPSDKFATVAEGTFEAPPGEYVLELTTDDGAKVWVDGKEVISNAWKYQGPTLYTANLTLGGKHTIKVEHFEIGGYAALKLNLRPR